LKQKTITTIFIAAFIFFGTKVSSVKAADYFVDSVGGNDSWDGQSQTYSAPNHGPWKTSGKLNWGPDFFGDDQILFKRGGVYSRLLVTSNYQSSDGHPITFGSYGEGSKPIITIASNIASSWNDLGGGRYSSQLSTGAVEVVLEDWNYIKPAKTADLTDGNWYFDSTNRVLYYKPSSGTPINHEVRTGGAASFGFYEKADSFVIQDIHFIGAGIYHGENGPDPFKNITVQRCEFTGNATIWIGATNKNPPINGSPATNFVIQDCTFKNNRSNIYFVTDGHGTWDGVIVRRNKFIDTDIMWDGTRYSTWSPGDIDGISVQDIKNSVFENNEISGGCYSGGIVVWFSNGFPGTGNIIRNNYIHDIYPAGILWGGEDNGTCNVKIYGNILANVAKDPGPNYSYYFWGGLRLNRVQTPSNPSEVFNNVVVNADANYFLNATSNNYILRNNISLNPRSNQHIRAPDLQNSKIDYNLYFGGNPDYFNRAYSQNRILEEWRNYTGQDMHSFIADPKFVNASGNFSQPTDFKLAAGSPAIDAGADVGLTSDFEGTPVPQGTAPDIGAFEYKAAAYVKADLNQDNSIDSADLDILKTDFLKLTANLSNSRSDINADGQCTVRDLGILMSGWK
jgi:hypothetical protein